MKRPLMAPRSDCCLVMPWDSRNKRNQRRTDHATFEGGDAAMTIYHVTLRDRETQTVVGYYNGAWTTDRRRALTLRKREVAETYAARMRDCCPRNAELITVEEIAAADQH
jgi:hypothetical protein